MSNPDLPEGVSEKDIDAIGEGPEPSYEELQEDLDEQISECVRLIRINRELLEAAKKVWALIDNNTLVRNTDNDNGHDYGMRILILTQDLLFLNNAIAKAEER